MSLSSTILLLQLICTVYMVVFGCWNINSYSTIVCNNWDFHFIKLLLLLLLQLDKIDIYKQKYVNKIYFKSRFLG